MSKASPTRDSSTLDVIRDQLAMNWNRLRDRVRTTFERLTDDDVSDIGGHYGTFSRRLAQRYGYDESRSDAEIARFVNEGGSTGSTPGVSSDTMPDSPTIRQVPGGDDLGMAPPRNSQTQPQTRGPQQR